MKKISIKDTSIKLKIDFKNRIGMGDPNDFNRPLYVYTGNKKMKKISIKDGNIGIGSIELSAKPTKLDGEICPNCEKENVWFTCYIGMGAPNVRCHFCGFEWTITPKTKLEIKGLSTYKGEK